MNANVPKNLSRGLPLPPHPQIDPKYTLWKVDKTFGQGPPSPHPPLIGQTPKEQLLFLGDLPWRNMFCRQLPTGFK